MQGTFHIHNLENDPDPYPKSDLVQVGQKVNAVYRVTVTLGAVNIMVGDGNNQIQEFRGFVKAGNSVDVQVATTKLSINLYDTNREAKGTYEIVYILS